MVAQSGDGAFVIDGEGRIVSWNSVAEKLLGHSAAEVLGRRCCDVFGGRDGHENRICFPTCHARALVRHGEVVHPYDLLTTTKSKSPIWLNVSVLSMPPFTIHLFRDVTVQRRLSGMLQDRSGRAPAASTTSPELGRRTALSVREVEVLTLLANGQATAGIAARLGVSVTTVRNHVQHILRKLGVHSRLEAITLAMRRGWVLRE